MATQVKRGLASVTGINGEFDVIVYPVAQSAKIDHKFELEKVKDIQGQTTAMITRDEMYGAKFGMKLLGDTSVDAKAAAAFLAPLAIVTLSGFDNPQMGTTVSPQKWWVEPGSSIDLGNTKVGDIEFVLERAADAAQNTLLTSIPD